MRNLVRTEVGLVATFAIAMLVAYIGLAVSISGEEWVGRLALAIGLWVMVAAPTMHDRMHREHGEESHALWGRNDRWKPSWLHFR